MEIKEILTKLEYNENGILPKEALQEAIHKCNEIIPELLNILKHISNDIKIIDEDRGYFAHIYAMLLLAQFREKKAYPLIIKFYTNFNDDACKVSGDFLTENLPSVLASVYNGNISLIKNIIENDDLNFYLRGAAVNSLLTLVVSGEHSREEILDYFYFLITKKFRQNYDPILDVLVSSCLDLYPNEKIIIQIKKLYLQGFLDPGYSGTLEEIEEEIQEGKESALKRLYNNPLYNLIDDVVSELENWACFGQGYFNNNIIEDDEPFDIDSAYTYYEPNYEFKEKIGRNEPCPCGSGKKYKKCCLQNETKKHKN